jgi:hypothetical protein
LREVHYLSGYIKERHLMKKIIAIALVVSFSGLYAMELIHNDEVKKFTHPMFPKIVVVQDDIKKRSTKNADITIVGKQEWEMQLAKLEDHRKGPFIGSLSVKGTRAEMKKSVETVDKENQLLLITEPNFTCELVGNDEYRYIYRQPIVETVCCCKLERMGRFTGTDAITRILSNLRYCYYAVLHYTHEYFTAEHTAKSIAIPTLGVALGIPAYSAAQIAVESAVEFTSDKKYKDIYDLIEFVVPDSETFNIYQNFLLALTQPKDEKNVQGNDKK